jgi:predicted PhzF superfamily epimerase YddE/YHI9
MNEPIRIVDTFADAQFAGNPAAVALCERLPSTEAMQETAHRVGLPTTAFLAPLEPAAYLVRWFTPSAEINLCGHATIASARCLFERAENTAAPRLRFVSDNGVLCAELTPAEPPAGLLEALGVKAVSSYVSTDDILIEVGSQQAVARTRPDFAALARQPFRGHIVTARAESEGDFVSRTFFPALGVDEDQVCVTAHCKLTPFWSQRLGRRSLSATQLSERGGRLRVEDAGERVRVLGSAIPRDGAELPVVREAVLPGGAR